MAMHVKGWKQTWVLWREEYMDCVEAFPRRLQVSTSTNESLVESKDEEVTKVSGDETCERKMRVAEKGKWEPQLKKHRESRQNMVRESVKDTAV